MLDKSIESNQEVKEVFEDYGVHFRRLESNTEQGKSINYVFMDHKIDHGTY